jgi:hypothetical protein
MRTFNAWREEHQARQLAQYHRRSAQREVAAIPKHVLPDREDRRALVAAIESGELDQVYRPVAVDHWNVCVAEVHGQYDQRLRLEDWLAWYHDGLSTAEIAAQMRATQDAQHEHALTLRYGPEVYYGRCHDCRQETQLCGMCDRCQAHCLCELSDKEA